MAGDPRSSGKRRELGIDTGRGRRNRGWLDAGGRDVYDHHRIVVVESDLVLLRMGGLR
jgi:hypothetical protein